MQDQQQPDNTDDDRNSKHFILIFITVFLTVCELCFPRRIYRSIPFLNYNYHVYCKFSGFSVIVTDDGRDHVKQILFKTIYIYLTIEKANLRQPDVHAEDDVSMGKYGTMPQPLLLKVIHNSLS